MFSEEERLRISVKVQEYQTKLFSGGADLNEPILDKFAIGVIYTNVGSFFPNAALTKYLCSNLDRFLPNSKVS